MILFDSLSSSRLAEADKTLPVVRISLDVMAEPHVTNIMVLSSFSVNTFSAESLPGTTISVGSISSVLLQSLIVTAEFGIVETLGVTVVVRDRIFTIWAMRRSVLLSDDGVRGRTGRSVATAADDVC